MRYIRLGDLVLDDIVCSSRVQGVLYSQMMLDRVTVVTPYLHLRPTRPDSHFLDVTSFTPFGPESCRNRSSVSSSRARQVHCSVSYHR